MKRTLRESKQNPRFKEVRYMSMVKEALRTVAETRTNQERSVAGIVNSIETLEGGGFLVRRVIWNTRLPLGRMGAINS